MKRFITLIFTVAIAALAVAQTNRPANVPPSSFGAHGGYTFDSVKAVQAWDGAGAFIFYSEKSGPIKSTTFGALFTTKAELDAASIDVDLVVAVDTKQGATQTVEMFDHSLGAWVPVYKGLVGAGEILRFRVEEASRFISPTTGETMTRVAWNAVETRSGWIDYFSLRFNR